MALVWDEIKGWTVVDDEIKIELETEPRACDYEYTPYGTLKPAVDPQVAKDRAKWDQLVYGDQCCYGEMPARRFGSEVA